MSFRYKYNRRLVPFSKANRKGQTDAEKLLDNEVLQNINGVLEQILINLTLPSPDRRGSNTVGPHDEGLGKK